MRRFLLVTMMAAGAARAEQPTRLGVPELRGVDVPERTMSFYSEHLAQHLRAPGLSVVTSREIATLLGVERQRQLLACSEASESCVVELANALGADAVVMGDVARFDNTFQLNVKVVSSGDATVMAARSARVEGDAAVLDALAQVGASLARALLEARGRPVPPELLRATAPRPTVRDWAWAPLGVGVAAAATGTALLVLAGDDFRALTTQGGAAITEDEALRHLREGQIKQTAGAVCLAAGLAAAAAAGAMFVFGRGPVSVTIAPSSSGAVFVVTGTWP